ncbi:hypothetical protein AWZ03_007595 [Drosophila navojoa]|uniref:Odorant receptor n=1 Tax=Drosophila navojoa TaxID=7232 RepID=A0A484BDY6_DRONA|nr:hypothetical protein AWZ03_007595 [Drosophila navojoa]
MFFKYIRDETLGDYLSSRDGFKYLHRGMKCVAWLPPKRGTRFYWPYIMWRLWIYGMSGIYLPIMLLTSYIINFKLFKPQELLGSVQVFFNATSLVYKVIVNLMNIWRFEKIMEMLDTLDKRCIQFEQQRELHRGAVRCNLVFLAFHATYAIYSTFAYLGAALTGSTAWVMYNPFIDYRASTKNLWIAATTEYIIASGAIYSDEMTDLYPVLFGITLRTHLQLLAKRVEILRTDPKLTEEQHYEQLVNCVKDHQLMLQ